MQRRPSMEVRLRPAVPGDLPHIAVLLREVGLITAGVADHLPAFLVAEERGRIVGSAGLEIYGDVALLRSVAVTSAARGLGVGRRLVAGALDHARHRGVRSVALLTEGAAPFFWSLGFREAARSGLDPRLAASAELSDPCCATAAAMILDLAGAAAPTPTTEASP